MALPQIQSRTGTRQPGDVVICLANPCLSPNHNADKFDAIFGEFSTHLFNELIKYSRQAPQDREVVGDLVDLPASQLAILPGNFPFPVNEEANDWLTQRKG
jgi:hypothetical protein